MGFKDVLKGYFPKTYTEVDFVKRSYNSLKAYGFNDENTIASVCICRDEISQSIRSVIKHMWGEAFNLSSLGGMFFAGKTGLKAAMHHAPIVDGKERYVFYTLPHIAMDEEGRIGVCKRQGREGDSVACGALNAFQKEISSEFGTPPPSPPLSKGGIKGGMIDNEDIEYSLIKMRLSKEIPYGKIPDLLELTRLTQKAIQEDIENTLSRVVDTKKSDYAVFSGIQIHGTDSNYVSPTSCYAVIEGVRKEVIL